MDFAEYIGRSMTAQDQVWQRLVVGLAATLDLPEPLSTTTPLPPLWHWMLFQQWLPAHRLEGDGHPQRGDFLPATPDLPRRMIAGGRLRFAAALYQNDHVNRTSSILKIEEKTGTTGKLLFVTVAHRITGPQGLAIEEELDLVYRPDQVAAVKPTEPAPPAPAGAIIKTIVPDSVCLFRYSALTGNSHRIHYDDPYVRNVEAYPGLVVHGPLQATWLAELVRANWPGRKMERFSYRGRKAAIVGGPLSVEAWEDNNVVKLQTRDNTRAICMTAEAHLT